MASMAVAGMSLSSPTRAPARAPEAPKAVAWLNGPRIWKTSPSSGRGVRAAGAVPEGISEKVTESIKQAEEACSDDPKSGECVAAWDEVEELSAASSHARARSKDSDPLETYCADNPETDECRTYDN